MDAVKCDAEKAYPSITVECSMKLLRRDIGKNKILLWFLVLSWRIIQEGTFALEDISQRGYSTM